jgi:acetyltransferase-like isoleucine patch superfamily enzyme
MSFFLKIIFNLTFNIQSYANKNKLKYYEFLYGNKLRVADTIDFGHSNSIVFYPEGGSPTIDLAAGNSFRQHCILSANKNGVLIIGTNNFFNNGCSINCMGTITIGQNNLFGENVKFYDHNHRFRSSDLLVRDQGFSIGSITIGSNCWIGSNCTILNNVTIGDNVIIGANNLIYKSIPANTIVKSSASYQLVDRY